MQYKLEDLEDLFLPLIGIESETNTFPMGKERTSWSPSKLKDLDRERDEYLAQVDSIISEACREIIAAMS